MKVKRKTLYFASIALFILGLGLCMLNLLLCNKNVDTYKRFDKPINTVEKVCAAEYCKTTDLIYVFYEMGCYVNVYSTSGDFKWAVQIPSQQNGGPSVVFHRNRLLFSFGDTYIIDAADGELTEIRKDREACEFYESTDSQAVDFSATKVEYTKNGKTSVIVKKSFITFILQPAIGAFIAFSGGMILILNGIVENIKVKKKH